MRAMISKGSDTNAAAGVISVNNDHHSTASPSTMRPPIRFAIQPLGAMNSM